MSNFNGIGKPVYKNKSIPILDVMKLLKREQFMKKVSK